MFFLLTSASTLLAQQRWSAGPRLGVNVSSLYGSNDNYYNAKVGLVAGGFVSYSSINHFGISADVLYSQRGAKYDNPGDRSSHVQHLNYLEIPVVARYYLNLSGNFRPNFFIGPSLGVLMGAKRTKSINQGTAYPDSDTKDEFETVDLGGTAGFQANFKVKSRQRFLIDARYTLGLTNVSKNATPWFGNSTFSFTLGYSFGVGRNY
ncbi:PorT family protein [Larkinella rosea]|uniref:PorT family protein n=2 Tax=Larkinella rosea TaxID=2025312 RepID=A0A3P1BDL9_9BACT|nr:PorT family protein [Larkinella rosea]